MSRLQYEHVIQQHLGILKSLQYDSGLFAASSKSVGTGYDKSWLRDNFYECLPFALIHDWETVKKTYRALLDVFIKHEYKIDHAIAKKPQHRHEYIHARIHPTKLDEFWEEWGNKQNDSIGAILYMIGSLHTMKQSVLQTPKDYEIIQKLVLYLQSLEYWQDPDSGMWEEDEEIHASSVGACVAGLIAVKRIPQIIVPVELIRNGKLMLARLLPRESKRKFADLALLSLIYPYHVTTLAQTREILRNVEYHLVKSRGVIRYKNDHYYNKNPDGHSEEAEWTFGFSWLAIIYHQLGEHERAVEFEKKALETINDKGDVPELYYSNSPQYNENSPLGWSEAMLVLALYKLNKKHVHLAHLLRNPEHAPMLAHFNR